MAQFKKRYEGAVVIFRAHIQARLQQKSVFYGGLFGVLFHPRVQSVRQRFGEGAFFLAGFGRKGERLLLVKIKRGGGVRRADAGGGASKHRKSE